MLQIPLLTLLIGFSFPLASGSVSWSSCILTSGKGSHVDIKQNALRMCKTATRLLTISMQLQFAYTTDLVGLLYQIMMCKETLTCLKVSSCSSVCHKSFSWNVCDSYNCKIFLEILRTDCSQNSWNVFSNHIEYVSFNQCGYALIYEGAG